MKTKWNEKTTSDKVLLVLRMIVSIAVLIGASLQIMGVWDKALNIAVPLISALILIQSIQEQKGFSNHWLCLFHGYGCYDYRSIFIM